MGIAKWNMKTTLADPWSSVDSCGNNNEEILDNQPDDRFEDSFVLHQQSCSNNDEGLEKLPDSEQYLARLRKCKNFGFSLLSFIVYMLRPLCVRYMIFLLIIINSLFTLFLLSIMLLLYCNFFIHWLLGVLTQSLNIRSYLLANIYDLLLWLIRLNGQINDYRITTWITEGRHFKTRPH